MRKDLVLLVVLNMPAHYNNGLPHQEHEQTADNGNDKKSNACQQNFVILVVLQKNQLLFLPGYRRFFFVSADGLTSLPSFLIACTTVLTT